jgi:glycosidase
MTRSVDASVLVLATALAAASPLAARAQGPVGGEISIDSARITGQVKIPPGPEYLGDAVFYQIYPQTFLDTNADGIGDLEGVIRKLDYVKSLGVDGFWINPFFASPFHDAGYDISDYYTVAFRYGTNDDARRMFEEAEKRGLEVLFDWVISYTSIDHPWFQASARQEKNRYSNWYIWTDNTWVDPPEAYRASFIKGYSRRNGQFMRNFFWSQPALNFGFASPTEPWMLPIDHPDVLALQEELKRVLRFWMDMGADGFRADMAGALVKTAHVTGNDQFFTTRGEGTKLFWRKIRKLMDEEYPGSFMVAEWSHPESALGEGGFHADFFHWFPGYNDLLQKESWRILNGYSEGHSFFDKDGLGSVTGFLGPYLDQLRKTEGRGYINLPLGNHDLSRLNIERSTNDLEVIYAFSLTMPGIPFIFNGNEIGMRQLHGQPFVEGAYKPRAGGRSPMQWTPGPNLGFSDAPAEKLYLPVDPAPDAPTVEDQEKDPASLLNRVRRLIRLKKEQKALKAYAEFVPVYAKPNAYPFVYARANGDAAVLVILNPAARVAEARFTVAPAASDHRLLAGRPVEMDYENGRYHVTVPGRSYAIYALVR